MNRRKSKQIKRKAHELMYAWLHTLVSSKDAKDITKDNYKEFFPTLEKYVYANQKLTLSAFTERWFIQKVKQESRNKEVYQITLQDIV